MILSLTPADDELLTLVDRFPDVLIWKTDRDLRLVYGRGGALTSLAEPVAGLTLFEFFRTRDRTFMPIARHYAVLRGTSDRFEYEWLGRTYDVRLEPALTGDIVDGVVGMAVDVTPRREVEQELRAALLRERAMLENIPDIAWMKDRQSRFVAVNGAFAKAGGRQPDQFEGKSDADIWPADLAAKYSADDAEVIRSGQRRRFIERMVNHAGETRWLETIKSPIRDEHGEIVGTAGMARDITEWRALEQQLERSRRVASLGRVTATLAHEFNNVLMGIQPFVELLRRGADDTPQNRIAIEQILRSLQRGKNAVAGILRYTRAQDPVRTPVRVSTIVEELCHDALAMLPANVRMRIDRPSDHLWIDADATQIAQVLTNLLHNAREAIGSSEGTISIHAVEAERTAYPFGVIPADRPYAHFAIRDSGPGIPRDLLAHVFEPLFTTKPGGSGVGLALAHQIVTAHEGLIFIDSDVTRGTTVHVFLPLTGEIAEATRPSVHVEGPPPVSRVLLVEDDETVAAGMAAMLVSAGVEVRVVSCGAAVPEATREFAPEAIVLDVGLPDMSGYDVHRALEPGVPVIFSTGHAEPPREIDGVRYLMKPYSFAELMQALRF